MNRRDANLLIVAVEVSQSRHGDYLKHLAAAYVKADKENRYMMKPLWAAIERLGELIEWWTGMKKPSHGVMGGGLLLSEEAWRSLEATGPVEMVQWAYPLKEVA